MIIDIHTHAMPEAIAPRAFAKLSQAAGIPAHTAGTAPALSESARAAGIGLSVVQPVATNPLKVDHLNAFALAINQHTDETGLMSFAALHPLMPELPQALRRIREDGFRGVKLHPVYQQTPVDEPAFLRALEGCYREDLIVLIHAGYDIGLPGGDQASVPRIRRMLRALPPQRLILAHMGGWSEWEDMDYLGLRGLYLDTAFSLHTGCNTFLTPEAFCRIVRQMGVDRVLFGTDSPWNDQAADIARLRQSGLRQEEATQILETNAAKLLRGE